MHSLALLSCIQLQIEPGKSHLTFFWDWLTKSSSEYLWMMYGSSSSQGTRNVFFYLPLCAVKKLIPQRSSWSSWVFSHSYILCHSFCYCYCLWIFWFCYLSCSVICRRICRNSKLSPSLQVNKFYTSVIGYILSYII